MSNLCIPVIVVTLIALSHMSYVIHSYLICAQELIGKCGLSVTFEGHIYCWHIYGYSMENKGEVWCCFFLLEYTVM